MKNLLSILLLFCCTALFAQSLHVDSTRFVSGIKCCTNIVCSIPTTDKGILFVGLNNGNPGGIIPFFPLDTIEYNVFIGKIDSNQHISWLKVYGGTQDDQGISACQTPDGGYAVLAETQSVNGDVTNNYGQWDIWLLRLDAGGNLLWQKNYGSTLSEEAISIANTPDHGFIMLGTSNGADNDVPFHYGSMWTFDWLVIKTDSVGNRQWSKTIGGTGDEETGGSILSAAGGYYIASCTDSRDGNCTDTAWHPDAYTAYDYYLIKLDTAGNVLWDSSYGGSGEEGVHSAIYDDRDSTIEMMGTTGSNDYMAAGDTAGMWLIKLRNNGRLIWQKAMSDTGGTNTGYGVCIAPNKGYMVCGETQAGGLGGYNALAILLDSSGTEITNDIFGGTGNETPYAIIPYLGGYAATGTSSSAIFTEGTCDTNYSGAYVSYIDYWPLLVSNIATNDNQLKIYPNPSDEAVQVIAPGNGNLVIMNCAGEIVFDKQAEKQSRVNIIDWASGLYIVQWQGADGSVLTTKLIKQ